MDNTVASQGSLFQFNAQVPEHSTSSHSAPSHPNPCPTSIVSSANNKSQESNISNNLKELPPMLRHYLEVKSQHPDRLIFYQVGDFYEVFFDDAYVVSDCLSIRLTSRDKDQNNPIPMCGVPIHAFSSYSAKLLNNGFGCVVVDQIEESSQAKGLVKRDIAKILTPGVSFDGEVEDRDVVNYILSILPRSNLSNKKKFFAVCVMEASTGKITLHDTLTETDLLGLITRYAPREIVLSGDQNYEDLQTELSDLFAGALSFNIRFSRFEYNKEELETIKNLLILGEDRELEFDRIVGDSSSEVQDTLFLLLKYIVYVSRCEKVLISKIQHASSSQVMALDGATIKNLELLTSYDGSKEFSLFGVIDKTRTALGSRQIKEWLLSPSIQISVIRDRHEKVSALIDSPEILDDIRKEGYEVRDLERLCTKLISGRISPYDLGLLLKSLRVVPAMGECLRRFGESQVFSDLLPGFIGVPELVSLLESALLDSLPIKLGEAPIFRGTYNEELQRLRNLESGSKNIINELEQREKQGSGISSLKIKHNSVLGYFIEIGINHAAKAPASYLKKQTLSNVERFFTPELKELEKEIYAATNKIESLERSLFLELKKTCLEYVTEIQNIGQKIAVLDTLCAFAVVSKENSYVRPEMTDLLVTNIKKGRHPVVEKSIGRAKFIPNDLELEASEKYFAVLTGPNMGGKSTYLRQVGVIQILAQAGCFVPADAAIVGVVDQIFTRIGAGDSLAKGESTFMVEMKEAAAIVNAASQNSLVLVDELGRGTATKDGYSLALAIAEWLIEKTASRTIFATHFHELNLLEQRFSQVKCLSVGIVETLSRIEFTHKIEMRAAEKSYGIHVARLAGIPPRIIARANEIVASMPDELLEVEQSESNYSKQQVVGLGIVDRKRELNNQELNSFIETLANVEPDSFTPKEAMNMVYDIVSRAQQLKFMSEDNLD